MTPPSRFGPNPKRFTVETIEAVVEWVERQTKPWTHHDAWHGVGAGAARWAATYKTIRELRDHGLVRRVNRPDSKPALWIRADAPKPEIVIDLEA